MLHNRCIIIFKLKEKEWTLLKMRGIQSQTILYQNYTLQQQS